MNKVRVLKERDPFLFACTSEERMASIKEEEDRFIVMGAWDGGNCTMDLAEFDLDGRDRSKRLGEACRFAIRWTRGVT